MARNTNTRYTVVIQQRDGMGCRVFGVYRKREKAERIRLRINEKVWELEEKERIAYEAVPVADREWNSSYPEPYASAAVRVIHNESIRKAYRYAIGFLDETEWT